MSNPVAFDYETYYKKSGYSLRSLIAEEYCNHELFDPYMIAVHDGTESWVGHPRDFNWDALNGRTLLAHNAYFDLSVTKRLQELGKIPKFTPKEVHCTANMTAYLCNRRSLDQSVKHLFGVTLDKSSRADAANRVWPIDFPEKEQKAMQEYALRDSFYCQKLFADHGHRWPTVERRLSQITIEQGMRGVRINVELLTNYILWTHEARTNIEKLIPWIKDAEDDSWDEFNTKPTSTKCIAEQCRRDGIPCAPVKSEDEDAYEEWENRYKEAHPWITCLSAWRSINRLYKLFLVMKARLRPDDTMPFALLYFGAFTGRWSGTAKVNMQNQRKEPVLINTDGLVELDEKKIADALRENETTGCWPGWVKHVVDMRALIIPRPGKKMIVSDLSQIEPRILAWLVDDKATLGMLASGMSIYEAHSRATMGWKGGELKKEDKRLYSLAKARVLGLGYGAAWEKFITVAKIMAGLDITEGDPEYVEVPDLGTGTMKKVSGYGYNSKKIVAGFREDNPLITGLWGSLDGLMKRSISGDFTMTLPNGRKMTYEHIRGERRIVPDPETKLPRTKTVFTAGIGGKRVITYGGKLTENIVQATARDVFGEHVVSLADAGLTNLFSSHDEAIVEVDKGVTAGDIESIMSVTPEWLEGCPIGAEAKEVEHYCK